MLCKESTSLALYDIQNANGGATEEMEPTPLERGLSLTEQGESVSSFAWHLSEENRLLYTTTSLNIKVTYCRTLKPTILLYYNRVNAGSCRC